MARIIKVIGFENKDTFGLVHVQLDDGTEGAVWIGGDCEAYFHKGRISVFIKKNKTIDNTSKLE